MCSKENVQQEDISCPKRKFDESGVFQKYGWGNEKVYVKINVRSLTWSNLGRAKPSSMSAC